MKRITMGREQRRRKDAVYEEMIRLSFQQDRAVWRRPPYAVSGRHVTRNEKQEGEGKMLGRKRMETPMLQDWDAVDMALKAIAEANNELAVINGSMNMQINALKEASDSMAKPYKEEIKKQELLIKEFTQANRADMKGKSRRLTFGTVGFRASTKLSLPKEIKKVITLLKKSGMEDCITVKEGVNKDILKTYDEKDILKVGGKLSREDTFYYETEQTAVAEE